MFLAVFAGISNGYSKILRNTRGKSSGIQAATTGLEGLARELRGAQQILLPAAVSSSGGTLRFTVVNPTNPLRLEPNPAPARTPVLVLNAPGNLQTVEYSCNGKALVRKVTDAGGATVCNQEVSDGVVGFSARWNNNGTVNVTATVPEDRNSLRTVVHTVLLPEGL